MNQEYSASLAKGIFVHKPSGRKKSAVRPVKEFLWYQQYKELWSKMEEQIQGIEREAYKETFNSLLAFIKSYDILKVVEIKEIPAAILVMGVNMPDHSNIFFLLEREMHLNDILITVILQAKDCSTFQNLMQKLVTGLIGKYQKEMKLENLALKKPDFTFSRLVNYYKSLPGSETIQSPRKSPSKRKRINTVDLKSRPIVILIQDVEAFKAEVLQDLILVCNLYVTELPVVLVFGMASAMVTLHNILPQKALCCLGIDTFYSMTAIEYLTKTIQKVVMSPENPFKLGPRIFQLVIDTVLYHDFSVSNLSRMLKFCLFEHFYENNIACVCCGPSQIKYNLQHLSNEHLEQFKKLPSLSQFVENNPECKSQLKKENDLKNLLEDLLNRQHSYCETMIVLLNCLFILTKDLPGCPLGKHLREIYSLSLKDRITSLPSYVQSVKLLKMHSKNELESKIDACLEFLSDSEVPKTQQIVIEVNKTFLDALHVLSTIREGDYEKQSAVCNAVESEKIVSRSQFQERIRLRLKMQPSRFENCRESIVDSFTSLFKNLHPPSDLPLHEVFYFDNALALKRHLMPVPRITLHKDLMNPQAHLRCDCCAVSENREIHSSMPDISILYKLHLECGKLINLYDWLQTFKAVKNGASENEANGDSEDEAKLNIRFMHTVSELQLLGFIKSTKRKTDHVQRLTFVNL